MTKLYEALFRRDRQGPTLHRSLRNGIRLFVGVGGKLVELLPLLTQEAFLEQEFKRCG